MKPWRFLDYWPEEGHNPIREWCAAQEERVQAEFDAALAALAQTPDWLAPGNQDLFRPLTRGESGLGEIVFQFDWKLPRRPKPTRRRFRVFGILRSDDREFVLLVASEKQRGNYNPSNAPQKANEYRLAYERGEGETNEHI
jgi:hypothetical protein